jgi:hypothetical protein
MFNFFLAATWSIIPQSLALVVWRTFSKNSVINSSHTKPERPLINKDFKWSKTEALAYLEYKTKYTGLDSEDEKLIRAIEIRKKNFFARPISAPAAIIAHTLTEIGKQNNDLRAINTALKLRDLVATSLPPIFIAVIEPILMRLTNR